MKAEVIVKEALSPKGGIYHMGNLVQHIEHSNIVIVVNNPTSPVGDHLFCGTCLSSNFNTIGEYSDSWVKAKFKQFNGEVTIKI